MFATFKENPQQTALMRYAVGVFLAMALAMSIAWPLAVLTPMFASMFLSKGVPFIGFKGGFKIVLVVIVSGIVGTLISQYLIQIPFLALSSICLFIFYIYYYAAGQGSPFVAVIGSIGIIALPILGQQSSGASGLFGLYLFGGISLTVGIVIAMHGLLPTPQPVLSPKVKSSVTNSDKRKQLVSALTSSAIVLPAIFLFFLGELVNSLLVLLLIVIMAQDNDADTGLRASIGLLAANFLGGAISVAYFYILTTTLDYGFLLLSLAAMVLLFGHVIFSDKPIAKLCSSAMTTFLLLTWSSLTSDGDSADAQFFSRMFQIMLATLYLIGARNLVNWIIRYQRPVQFE
jgi:DUF2955 family protein